MTYDPVFAGGAAALHNTYDAHHRNPLHCGADSECVWELQRLTQHYHPSVVLFASSLLKVQDGAMATTCNLRPG